MSKPMKKWPFALILLLVAAGAGWFFLGNTQVNSSQKGRVASAEVVTGSIEEMVTAQGKLEPKEFVDVGAQVSGQVKILAAEIGDTVKAGDLIAEIDPEVFLTRVAANEARLKTLQAQKIQREAEANSARQKLKRAQLLIKDNAISKELLEDAQTAVRVADAQTASLSAQIEEAVSTLEGDKANLSYTKIYATMDGTVVAQSVREGQTVNANQTAPTIVQVANLDVMTVKAQVAEADIMKLKEDMPAYFTTLGSNGRRWDGVVRQILPSPEVINDVVLYNVLIDVANKDRQLMSGMSAQLFFVSGKADNVPLVPVTALLRPVPAQNSDQGEAYQVKVMTGTTITEKIVHIGLMDRSVAEVRHGLKAGDKVVLPALDGPSSSTQPGGRMRAGGPRL
jgi:macrolide-specific efflux system membrane fusion protein